MYPLFQPPPPACTLQHRHLGFNPETRWSPQLSLILSTLCPFSGIKIPGKLGVCCAEAAQCPNKRKQFHHGQDGRFEERCVSGIHTPLAGGGTTLTSRLALSVAICPSHLLLPPLPRSEGRLCMDENHNGRPRGAVWPGGPRTGSDAPSPGRGGKMNKAVPVLTFCYPPASRIL